MRFLPLILLLILMEARLHGEIGATMEQCIARYGKPERDALNESGLLCFRKDDLCTIAHFYKGKCDVLSIFSAKEEFGVPEDLPANRIRSLLKSEGASPEWVSSPRYTLNGVWCTPDRVTFAIYDTMRHKLAIMNHDAYMREKQDVAKTRAGLKN